MIVFDGHSSSSARDVPATAETLEQSTGFQYKPSKVWKLKKWAVTVILTASAAPQTADVAPQTADADAGRLSCKRVKA